MKGIILAGGSGTRLFPLTKVLSKQLLPVYDKPMIYYPLSTLMLAGIRDILIISTKEDIPRFESLLENGENFGLNISYEIQEQPNGLAEAFIIGEKFIGNDSVAMVLGDNIFYGGYFRKNLDEAKQNAAKNFATIFGYYVKDPKRFGIVELDNDSNVLSIEEKPENPKSNYCVTGLYFYDNSVIQKAKTLIPSSRGELEITDINKLYLEENKLKAQVLGRGFAWMDAGTIDSLMQASEFVSMVQSRQGVIISSPEEIAFRLGWISKEKLINLASQYGKSSYGQFLLTVAQDKYKV